jgi:hypothetical protein
MRQREPYPFHDHFLVQFLVDVLDLHLVLCWRLEGLRPQAAQLLWKLGEMEHFPSISARDPSSELNKDILYP